VKEKSLDQNFFLTFTIIQMSHKRTEKKNKLPEQKINVGADTLCI